jgi:hypothetical protein
MHCMLPRNAVTQLVMAIVISRIGAVGVALLMLLWAAACSRDGGQDAVLREAASGLVPDDAADKTTASGLPWVQISFTVRRPPLEFAIDEARLGEAASKGWSLFLASASFPFEAPSTELRSWLQRWAATMRATQGRLSNSASFTEAVVQLVVIDALVAAMLVFAAASRLNAHVNR